VQVIASSPLEHKGILRNVLSHVGLGHWLFIVPVCKSWHAEYKALAEELLTQPERDACNHSWCRDSEHWHGENCASVTFLKAALSSAACLQAASAQGLRFATEDETVASHLSGARRAQRAAEVKQQQDLLIQLGKHASSDVILHVHEEHEVEFSKWVSAGAALSDLAKLQWMREEQRCAWVPTGFGRFCMGASPKRADITIWAARSGNMAMLHWLREKGVLLFPEELLHLASVTGDLGLLQFLASAPGFNMDERHYLYEEACFNAAANRHLQALQWLHERGAPLAEGIGVYAAAGGSVPLLTWLAEVLPEEHWSAQQLTRMLQRAGSYGSLEACIWLRQRGAEWPDELSARFENRDEVAWKQCVLDWARAEGCTTEHPDPTFCYYEREFAPEPLLKERVYRY
jgi:hypothetical protein